MAKKIFDIVPPGGSFEEKESVREKVFTKKSGFQSSPRDKKERKTFSFKGLLILAVFLAIISGAAYFLIEAEAKIEIWPETSNAKSQDQILLKGGEPASQADFEQKTIPAVLIQKTIEEKITFSATGAVQNNAKASGKLRVYNKYEPPTAFTLVKNTRFLSSPQGKTFKSLNAINLPAASYKDGKLVYGFVDIEVEADEAGSDYNIESSSSFSIPKLVGTNYFYTTWAENIGSLAGGSDTGVKTVTREDLDNAKDLFLSESFKKAKESLSDGVESGFVLADSLISHEIEGEIKFSAEEKSARDSFEVSGKIVSKALIFKQSDLDDYSAKLLASLSKNSQKIVPGTLKVLPEAKTIDFNKQTAEVGLSINAKAYMLEENQKIKELLRAQKIDYAVSLINNYSGVEKADIKIFPFWKKKIPSSMDKIEIKLNFENN